MVEMPSDFQHHEGTTIQRLDRLEAKVDDLHEKVERLSVAEARRIEDRLLPDKVRVLEDQVLELRIYLRQAKWAVALAIGAVITGVLNLIFNVVIAGALH